tara:strand:+ start:168 stop:422 length:255 start_codon:yes stop_codon:yes gene_type:complete
MAKKLKITKDELTKLQVSVRNINQTQIQIGILEIQKSEAIDSIKMLKNNLVVLQKEMEDKYGSVNVNINDGTISDKDGESDKKN